MAERQQQVSITSFCSSMVSFRVEKDFLLFPISALDNPPISSVVYDRCGTKYSYWRH